MLKLPKATEIQAWLIDYLAQELEIEPEAIDTTVPFERYGLDSSAAIALTGDLEDWLGCELEPELLFDYQTIAELTEYIVDSGLLDSVSPTPQATEKVQVTAIFHQQDTNGVYPLSDGQQALWFLYKLAPESSAYNVAFTARIGSEVGVASLRSTFQKLVDRHSLLRTTFGEQDGQAVQQVHPHQEVYFEEIDAANWDEEQLKQEVIASNKRPFDLEHGPVLRVSLFKISKTDYVLLISLHHIVCDGWSVWMLLYELRVLYPAEQQGNIANLPPLKFSYADYVNWQLEMLSDREGEKLQNYWREELAGELPILNLPTDRPRPVVQTYNGASHKFSLDRELTQQLRELAHAEGVSLFMLLLAAYQVLLYRYTNQEDILVGVPMKCRNQTEFTKVFGYLVNPVVLRADLSGNPNFKDFLHQVRHKVLGAVAHQDYPFPLLVDELEPKRDSSRSPLVQTMFVLQKPQQSGDILDLFTEGNKESQVNWGGLQLEPFDIPQQEGQFDLSVEMMEAGNTILGVFHYNTDLFDDSTIQRLEGHFQRLLQGIVAHPEEVVGKLPLLTEAELHQLLVEWNDTKVDYPQDKCIHELFEEQVAKTPDAVAVVFEEEQLTYQELNSRANQLAHYLQKLGVAPEVLVGICVERSPEMIIALLATLKVGGAYVPLDPTYPTERLAYMLDDSQVSTILTHKSLLSQLPVTKAKIVTFDSPEIVQASLTNPISIVKPDNLAYIIYTSGSTGKPKGVQIAHQGLCNLAKAQIKLFDVNSTSRVLQFASFSFDAAIWEILMAICSGACLCLGTKDSLLPGENLMELLRKQKITHITLPPSSLAILPKKELPDLEVLIVAGEACPPELAKQWSKQQRFFNAYGPSESTVCATVAECTEITETLPIGNPILNTQVYILDKNLQPLPVGVPGELHISSVGLAKGYLNRPELTNEKFISMHPQFLEKGIRGNLLYKTGDLARYLPDGNIEFLGRIDHQVKIRGFRIELEEIQTVLQQDPEIRETLVIEREDRLGNKRLVAYIVSNTDSTNISELRNFLAKKLPDYMIPNAFVKLNALPLTPNGKVNRHALPAPEQSRREIAEKLVQPLTAIEQTLANIWTEVLGLEEIGINENFFELGGDSILSIQIVAKANQLGWKITPKQIFQNQTIAELANVATQLSLVKAEQSLVTGEVPLTPIQEWFFAQNQSKPHHFNQAVLLEVSPDLQPELLEEVIRELLHHHDSLRLKFVQNDLGWQQLNALPTETLPFTKIDLSNLEPEKQKTAIESIANEQQGNLNLAEGLIIKATLFNLGKDQPSRLLLIIHHLAVDGVSWRILLEDLATAYQQLRSGEAIQLPAKTTSFQYWAKKLREYAAAPTTVVSELDYWLSQRFSRPLPVDYPLDKSLNTVASAVDVSVSLNEAETHALLQEVPKAYNTQINDVLLTSLVQSFTQWTGESSLLIDLEGHGREELFEDVDLSRTVGWFTTIYPVLLPIDQNSSPGEALKSIKEELRRIPQNGIGYGILRYLSQEKAISNQLKLIPQAEVSFNYLGQLDQISSLDPILGFAEESIGLLYDLQGKRNHLLEINAFIKSGKLQINWTYSKEIHQHTTVENIAQRFKKSLQSLITHCLSPVAGGYTPSDFPLAKLSAPQLEQIINITGPNIEDIYPLSPSQQDICFYQVANPKDTTYFIQNLLVLEGELNVLAWKQSWEKVLVHHPTLRTTFLWNDLDRPLQIVHKSCALPWVQHDWRSCSPSEQEKNLKSFLELDRNQGLPIDLAPLMRCTLIQLDDRKYKFIWSNHHILLDGWSLPIILRDVFTIYEALNQGKDLHLESPVPYSDYIAWYENIDLTNAQSFWVQRLNGFDFANSLNLKLSSNKFQKQNLEVQREYISLPERLKFELQAIAQRHHFTLSSLIQGIWAISLHKYSGKQDILLGNAFSGRSIPLPGIESMLGLFSNVLPTRITISKNSEFIPWIQKLHAKQVELDQYAYISIIKIREWCDISSKQSLYESLIAFENYPLTGKDLLEKTSVRISDIKVLEQPSGLNLSVLPGDKLLLGIDYCKNLFDQSTISSMIKDMSILIEKIANNPNQLIIDFL